MQTSLSKYLVASVAFVAAGPAFGWGDVGHLSVCGVAWQHLTQPTRLAIGQILGVKPADPSWNFAFARQCVWPDEVKKTPDWTTTAAFHFINVETMPGETPNVAGTTWDDPAEFAGGGDMLQALVAAKDALSDPSRSNANKKCHLRIFGHLGGDSHQPMHYGKRSDFGGNLVQIHWRGNPQITIKSMKIDATKKECFQRGDEDIGKGCTNVEPLTLPSNLHSLWDDVFIDARLKEKLNIDMAAATANPFEVFPKFVAYLEESQKPRAAALNEKLKEDLLSWAELSAAARVKMAYTGITFSKKVPAGADGKQTNDLFTTNDGDEKYYADRIRIIEDQIESGGYHLAGQLNQIFDKSYAQTISQSARGPFNAARENELRQRMLAVRLGAMVKAQNAATKANEAAKAAGKPERPLPFDQAVLDNAQRNNTVPPLPHACDRNAP